MPTSLHNINEELEEEFEELHFPTQALYSREALLPSPRRVLNTAPNARAAAPPLAPNTNKKCQIHLATYCRLFGFLLFGAGIAVSHHFFYQSLNGQPVSDLTLGVPGLGRGLLAGFRIDRQQLYLQIGTLMAWIAQGCFAATINAAYNQYAWTIMRAWSLKRGAVRARSLECMFSGSSDLTAFLDPRFIRAAPISWFIAGFIWLMPLTGLFTQATLNVAQSVDAVSTTLTKGSTTASRTAITKYAYKQKTLALSYGISFSFALFWALVGLICLVKNRGVGYGMRSFSSILTTAWLSELQQGTDELSKAEQGMREDVREHVSQDMEGMFGVEDWNHQDQPRNGHRKKGGKNSPRARDSSILATTLESEVQPAMSQLNKAGQDIRQDISEDTESMLDVESWNHQEKNRHGRKGTLNNQLSPKSSFLVTNWNTERQQGMNQLSRDIRQDISEDTASIFRVEGRNQLVKNGHDKQKINNQQPRHLTAKLESRVQQGIDTLSEVEQNMNQDVSEDLESMFGNRQVKDRNGKKGRNKQWSRNSSNLTTSKATTTWESEVQEELNRLGRAEQDVRQDVYRGVSEDPESMFEVEGWTDQVENEHGRRERQNPAVDEPNEPELD